MVHIAVNSRDLVKMESSEEAGCQAREGPKLCINNCGFFGSATTMNMCSKCHKDMVLKQQEANLAASSIEKFVNGSSNSPKKVPIITDETDVEAGYVELNAAHTQLSSDLGFGSGSDSNSETNTKEGPNRCTSCLKRLGLTGFKCKCGKLFCSSHRYSDKHDCSFDYRSAARDAIAKENPVVKAEKLDKI